MRDTFTNKYAPVGDKEKNEVDRYLDDDSNDHDREGHSRLPLRRSTSFAATPWILTIFFATLSLYLFIQQQREARRHPYGTYEDGFATDIIPGTRIPLEKVAFTRSPTFSDDGAGHLPPADENAPWPDNLVLFGEPSPEIDANWHEYIGGRYFSLTEEEITNAVGKERLHEFVDQGSGGYSAGLDVFHTLHSSQNSLRRMFHAKHYNISVEKSVFHTEHCLDALRRHVQCYGSTTLIPTQYWDGLEHNYINTDVTHTCRSFSFLRDFTRRRMRHGDLAVERDMGLVDAEKHKKALNWRKANPGEGH